MPRTPHCTASRSCSRTSAAACSRCLWFSEDILQTARQPAVWMGIQQTSPVCIVCHAAKRLSDTWAALGVQVAKHFPTSLGVDDFIARIEMVRGLCCCICQADSMVWW
jgi:hypothetical protein